MLAIIPARKGSKGFPKKNMAFLNQKPLIQYSIEAALASQHTHDVMVTTDDEGVMELASSLGVKWICQRPSELAGDETPMYKTILHALDWYQSQLSAKEESIILLQPTSPMRTAEDIDRAIELFFLEKSDGLASVNIMKEHPNDCIQITKHGPIPLHEESTLATRRQDYSNNFFYINGAIYIVNSQLLSTYKTFVKLKKMSYFLMPYERSIDIDSEYDLKICQALLT
jgi:N-acylneuraminate cytidylyltransferase/CMP-N,N'-diacetyllegionaminic acid synthase